MPSHIKNSFTSCVRCHHAERICYKIAEIWKPQSGISPPQANISAPLYHKLSIALNFFLISLLHGIGSTFINRTNISYLSPDPNIRVPETHTDNPPRAAGLYSMGWACISWCVTRLDGARGKKQIWRLHVWTWGLSEANVLYWRNYFWHCWDFRLPSQSFGAPIAICHPGNCGTRGLCPPRYAPLYNRWRTTDCQTESYSELRNLSRPTELP